MRVKKAVGFVAGALVVGVSTIVGITVNPGSALAACTPDPYYRVTQVGSPTYSSIGSAAGKKNGGSTSSTLSIALQTTSSKSTSWSISGGASVSWGIAEVELETSYSVTSTTTTGKTVTDTLNVPAGYYGYAQPKVEFRKFHIEKMQTPGNCGPDKVVADMGTLQAITAYPFFSECTSKSACTPKP